MPSLGKIFSKYTGDLRSIRLFYFINNLLNARKLRHNKKLYQEMGLHKSIYSSIQSKDFEKSTPTTEIPWLDRPNAREALLNHPDYMTFDSATREQLLHWIENGYIILKRFYAKEETEELNREIERLLARKDADFNFTGRKIMNGHEVSPIIDTYFRNKRIVQLLNFIMGEKVYPFQTINFVQGSEQRAHSDSIHMTSEPKGYLVATWVALEDTDDQNGPLFYYPGSHKLPYIMSTDYNSGNSRWRIGKQNYKRYEDKIEEVVQQNNLKKAYFYAKQGDVLIWHANLIHGGSPIKNEERTRKSMVSHYFCEDVVCYHEISQRPALLEFPSKDEK